MTLASFYFKSNWISLKFHCLIWLNSWKDHSENQWNLYNLISGQINHIESLKMTLSWNMIANFATYRIMLTYLLQRKDLGGGAGDVWFTEAGLLLKFRSYASCVWNANRALMLIKDVIAGWYNIKNYLIDYVTYMYVRNFRFKNKILKPHFVCVPPFYF